MPINEKHDQRMIGMLEEFRMNKKRSGRTKQRCISQSLHKAKLIVNLVFEPIHPRVCIFGKLSSFFGGMDTLVGDSAEVRSGFAHILNGFAFW